MAIHITINGAIPTSPTGIFTDNEEPFRRHQQEFFTDNEENQLKVLPVRTV